MSESFEPRRHRGTAVRLFLTCWLVYSFHVATNMVRESYLALAIGDHASFRVDEYAGMHDDIFVHPGYGSHIGSNPGASMLGAIPYALARPLIDPIVRRVQESRVDGATPPRYDAPTETDRRFYEEAWRRGLDVKFGLASVAMQSFAMATVSGMGVVLLYFLLLGWVARRTALWLSLLYAFGTPVFLRSGFLNHNMMMATAALIGVAALWNPWSLTWLTPRRRFGLAGLAGGASVLLDYSGILVLGGLLLYGVFTVRNERGLRAIVPLCAAYAVGALGPLALLWFYQWRSFGHPFLPPQHWMPPVEYIEEGYQGVALPQADIARLLAFDYRYGLFVSCPLFLLAIAAPFVNGRGNAPSLPKRELVLFAGLSLAFFLFFSGVHYTRWQFNTGVRYLAPTFPFLFLLTTVALVRLPRAFAVTAGAVSVAFAWCLAMVRDVSGGKVDLADPDAGLGVLDPVVTVFTEGPQLPVLTTLSRMDGYGPLSSDLSPMLAFAALAALLYLVWRTPARRPKP